MFLRYNLAGIAWALLILLACGMPGEEVPETSFIELPLFDKLVHGFLFLVFAFLLSSGFKRQFRFPLLQRWNKTGSFLVAFLYGILMEGMQYALLPERSLEAADTVANAIGAGLGIASFRGVYGKELA